MGTRREGVAFCHIQPDVVARRRGGRLSAGAEHQRGRSRGRLLVYGAERRGVSETTVAGASFLLSSSKEGVLRGDSALRYLFRARLQTFLGFGIMEKL